MQNQVSESLVAEIARCLEDEGAFVRQVQTSEFGTSHLQAVVDIGWAARQAGRLLGRQVRVTTSRSEEPGRLVVTVELLDATG